VFEANLALAEFLGLDVAQTLAVNAVADIGTFCTSLIVRSPSGQITHVRNLDFAFEHVMKKLVYKAVFVQNGQIKATAPLIAGFYGAYTGSKSGAFSISYNVRETGSEYTTEVILEQLERNLDSFRQP